MFSHLTVGTNDLARAKAFYDAVLPLVGWSMQNDQSANGAYGFAPTKGGDQQFWITRPFDRKTATFGNGVTVGFNADTRAQVDAFSAAALAAGGLDEGAPGLRPHYHPHYYGTYVRDLDGNKLGCVCHLPE